MVALGVGYGGGYGGVEQARRAGWGGAGLRSPQSESGATPRRASHGIAMMLWFPLRAETMQG